MAAVERRVATQLVGKSYALAAPLEPSQSEPAVLLDTITPEALGVRGFYLDHTGSPQRHRATMCQPLRWLGYKLACLLHEFRPICVCATTGFERDFQVAAGELAAEPVRPLSVSEGTMQQVLAFHGLYGGWQSWSGIPKKCAVRCSIRQFCRDSTDGLEEVRLYWNWARGQHVVNKCAW